MKYSLKYNFNDDTFYNYKVRSININNVQMYIANDLINQYNIKNKTNKLFKDWFRSKYTQELLNVIRNEKIFLMNLQITLLKILIIMVIFKE